MTSALGSERQSSPPLKYKEESSSLCGDWFTTSCRKGCSTSVVARVSFTRDRVVFSSEEASVQVADLVHVGASGTVHQLQVVPVLLAGLGSGNSTHSS